jgi:hypothetical protein
MFWVEKLNKVVPEQLKAQLFIIAEPEIPVHKLDVLF